MSPADALTILNLLLQNETNYEVYTYFLGDTAGEVERLGLAADILNLIPFDGKGIQNSPTGDMPKGFWDWLVSIFVAIVTFIVGIIVAIVNFIVQLVLLLVDWGIKLLGWLFENVVLNAIKLLILVFFFLLLALATIALLIGLVFLGLTFLPITLILGGSVHFGFLSVGLEFIGSAIWLEGVFSWAYSTFLGLDLPTLTIQFRLNEDIIGSYSLSLSDSSPQNINTIGLTQQSNISDRPLNNQASSPLELALKKSYSPIYNEQIDNSLQKEPPTNRTLLLVHGFSGSSEQFLAFGSSLQFSNFTVNTNITSFYNNIVAIDYYYNNNYTGNRIMDQYVDQNTPIEDISAALTQFILDHPEKFHKTIDIVTHSMGGLVVRYMIKHNYTDLVKAGYQIDDVITIATPNHGTIIMAFPALLLCLVAIIGFICIVTDRALGAIFTLIIGVLLILSIIEIQYNVGGTQGGQMTHNSNFLNALNDPDETPYGIDDQSYNYKNITWSTFQGNVWFPNFLWSGLFVAIFINPISLFNFDGLVEGGSVPLAGARNYGPYSRDHDQLLDVNDLTDSLFVDLYSELSSIRTP